MKYFRNKTLDKQFLINDSTNDSNGGEQTYE